MKKLVLFLTLVLGWVAIALPKTRHSQMVLKNTTCPSFISRKMYRYSLFRRNLSSMWIYLKRTSLAILPLKNVLRIRLKDSVKTADAVVTITGEKFIAQYHILSADPITGRDAVTEIAINPADTRPLDISGVSLSQPQLKSMALNLFCKRPGHPIEHTKAFGLKASLYRIYSAGDYIFLNLGYENRTNLKYDLDELRFKVDDKKITKATNVQSVEIKPEYVLFDNPVFQHSYRNIIVLKKMSFPGDKVLHIELSEKQLSGRVITLTISYKDLLDADVIPL